MKTHWLTKPFYIMGAATLLMTSGCATAFVRSKNTTDFQHVFPATAFDGEIFWCSGVQGEPLFGMLDPKAHIDPVSRLGCGVGSINDLPFSIVFDTILLPSDLSRDRTGDTEGKREPDSAKR